MPIFVVRAWLPDRPGALGAVASRIGAVRGDVVGIDILERGGGRAIDELVVELPDEGLVPLLVAEIAQVDGVDVEDVRPARAVPDPRVDALDTVAVLVEQPDPESLLSVLADHLVHDLEADWVAVVDARGTVTVTGPAPEAGWLGAFVAGCRSSEAASTGEWGPDDVAWTGLGSPEVCVVLGRERRPFRLRERRQLDALGRIAGQRLRELSGARL